MKKRRLHFFKLTGLFVLATLLCLLAGQVVLYKYPASGPDYYLSPKEQTTRLYLASEADSNEHRVLYHGLRGTAKEMKEAEVIFCGDSRLLLGLRAKDLRRYFSLKGKSFYQIACGHGERAEFALRLMEKHDLHPEVVVVNADGFFHAGLSEPAKRTIGNSRFQAWKNDFENQSSWNVRAKLHQFVPSLWTARLDSPMPIFRSVRDGGWHPVFEPARQYPLNYYYRTPDLRVSEEDLTLADEFSARVRRRGAKLVLTFIPGRQQSYDRARIMADRMKAPLILFPPGLDLYTFDASHLTRESAGIMAKEFLRQFDVMIYQN